jgi:hypothetical protein
LDDRHWIESIGNFLSKKSPERWHDRDEAEFHHQLQINSERFKRTELVVSQPNDLNGKGCRVLLTTAEGHEVGDLVDWEGLDEDLVNMVEIDFRKMLESYGRHGFAAAIRAVWKHLELKE